MHARSTNINISGQLLHALNEQLLLKLLLRSFGDDDVRKYVCTLHGTSVIDACQQYVVHSAAICFSVPK